MNTVTSKDGTKIAYDKAGSGPVVILVDGAFGNRGFGPNGLTPLLSPHFTVITYDRRGRNESGDTLPYAIEREVEDIEALIKAEGGSAYVYGISSGAVLVAYAAGSLKSIKKVALYEPPLVLDDSRKPVPKDYLDHLKKLIAADKRGDAVKYFMGTGVGVPSLFVFMMQFMPAWKTLKSVAHTVVYDTTIMGDFTISAALSKALMAIKVPTLVMDGGKSPSWLHNAAESVAKGISGSKHGRLEGQTHQVEPAVLAPALIEHFKN